MTRANVFHYDPLQMTGNRKHQGMMKDNSREERQIYHILILKVQSMAAGLSHDFKLSHY